MYIGAGTIVLWDHLLCERSKMCSGGHMYTFKLRSLDFSNWVRALPAYKWRHLDGNNCSFCYHDCAIHPPSNRQWKQHSNYQIRK
jgi:hypothetical protein